MSGAITEMAAVAVLVLIAFGVTRSRKRKRSEWDAAPAAVGLEPVSALDPALTAAIIALHRPPVPDAALKQTWSLTRVYRYPEPGVNCYSITIHLEQTGEVWRHGRTMRTESRETRVVAVVAPGTLQAPRLQLMPRAVTAPTAGALAALAVQAANAITDEAAEHAGSRVEFGDDPDFDLRYLVLSPHPAAARAYLDSTRRSKLAGLEGAQVSLEGSLMLVSDPTAAIRHRDRRLEDSLRAELEEARRLLTVFGSRDAVSSR